MKHLIALSLGTLALGIAEFGMMAILTPLALSLGVTIAEAGHFISLKAVKSTLKGFAHRTASRMPDLAWLFR